MARFQNIVDRIEIEVINTLQDGGINAIAENSLDVEFEVKTALAKQGICTIVAVPRLTHQGATPDELTWDANIQVQILENPPVNRPRLKKAGLTAGTAMDLAIQAANALAAPRSYNRPKYSCDEIEETVQDGLVLVTLSVRSLIH